MNIIAHRGHWFHVDEKNTERAFRPALERGFGIETDLRDYKGQLVISHDIADESSMTFKTFMSIAAQYPKQTLALNIKSDGLQELVKEELAGHEDYFCFDMSLPDSLGYIKNGLTLYARVSDLEVQPTLLAESQGIWLDNFSSNTLNRHALDEYMDMNKIMVLVSPELHGYDYDNYWKQLKNYMIDRPDCDNKLGLCTDHPIDAREYFHDAKSN